MEIALSIPTSCACFRRHVWSKTVLFIWGLIISHTIVEYAVVNVLMDYLSDLWRRPSLREAAMVVNLLDFLSAMLVVGLTHMSESYTGLFSVNILCTGAYAMGFMLLWVFNWSENANLSTMAFGFILIAVGKAGKEPILREFLDHQLNEKVKKKTSMNIIGDDVDQRISSLSETEEERNESRSILWWLSAKVCGAVFVIFFMGEMSWVDKFQIAALVMGALHVLLYSGFPCYYLEQKPTGNPLVTIYKVFKEAIKKRNLSYPSLELGYYSNIIINPDDPNDSSTSTRLYFYHSQSQDSTQVHLLPRVRLFTFLDKAAINNGGEVCTVEQVREVKSLYPLIPMATAFYAYSLVSASGNTYFVEQFNHLDQIVSLTLFFVLRSITQYVVVFLVSWFGRSSTVKMIGIGLFCAVLCSFSAWQVELRRLYLINQEVALDHKKPDDDFTIPLNVLVMIPQFVFLGLMQGFAEDGLEEFFYDHTPTSMKRFGHPFVEVTMGIGKLNSIFCVLILQTWFKQSIDTSHMDRYFLFLAILSFIFFFIYVCLYTYLSAYLCTFESMQAQDGEPPLDVEEQDVEPPLDVEEDDDEYQPELEPESMQEQTT